MQGWEASSAKIFGTKDQRWVFGWLWWLSPEGVPALPGTSPDCPQPGAEQGFSRGSAEPLASGSYD